MQSEDSHIQFNKTLKNLEQKSQSGTRIREISISLQDLKEPFFWFWPWKSTLIVREKSRKSRTKQSWKLWNCSK